MKKKNEVYKGKNCQIQITKNYLVIIVDASILDVCIKQDSVFEKGKVWLIEVGQEKYGLWFDGTYPDLLYGRTSFIKRTNQRCLKIPLGKQAQMKEFTFYLGNEKYVRSRELKQYWKQRLKVKN